MTVINTTHFKTLKDFVKFVLTFKEEKDFAVFLEQEHFTVFDIATMSNNNNADKFFLLTIAANAFLFKRNNMFSKELQNITEI